MEKEIDAKIVSTFHKVMDHYGPSKYHKDYPALVIEKIDPEAEMLCGWFDSDNNIIFMYTDNIPNEEEMIRTVVHEYTHYLQSSTWLKRYTDMYGYFFNPYEIKAREEENNWELFK